MKTLQQISLFLFTGFLMLSCNPDKKTMLFNGEDLDNWVIFTGDQGVEPGEVFWVEDGLIRTSGKPNGYLRTSDSYSNYKLHVEWRWTEEPTNSGVLLHVQGEDMVWPLAIECQLMHGNAGDLVLIGKGAGVTVRDSSYLVTSEERRFMIIPKFEETSENEPGEWNNYDIISKDGNVTVTVNGVLQNEGTGMTLTEGKILLQSEGSPMEFRNIYIESL
jgi:hypothetical protein